MEQTLEELEVKIITSSQSAYIDENGNLVIVGQENE